ncbi:MAG: hypothetical protein COV72_03355 [Candidatus Omnitrophica bacterium CG11_big_fil_rev_8_21_14_0_20_42_13]|uniref:Uncharacterized protein n=1 Tax=Candidatus Ghiorseimicrobium undicola TaxID=1974746 RepID=A0A2H0LYE7_9BACT|nr:MAG: hypothetical protein COV72_03355 [Candidatus Omnitrophica bacterium CG11_big_fil_rev_8_21_14_0_20_42_13]
MKYSKEQILNTSVSFNIAKYLFKIYPDKIEQVSGRLSSGSRIFKTARVFFKNIKIYIKYSFFERISRIRQDDGNLLILNNSSLAASVKNAKLKSRGYFRDSFFASGAVHARGIFCYVPLRAMGIIAVTAVFANFILIIILGAGVSLWGLWARLIFLVPAFFAITCNADWQTLKKTSFILRYGENKNLKDNRPS